MLCASNNRSRVLNVAIMSKSLRAALLSGLVFPGLGQIILKHYKRGVVLMLTVLASLSVVVVKAIKQALTILDQIQSGDVVISMSTILNAAHQASTTSDDFIINLVLLFIVFCWIIGIIDAYRIGKQMDAKGNSLRSLLHSNGNYSHNKRMDSDKQKG